MPELVIAEHLGHHGLGSLHIYGQVRDQQRQNAVDAMGRVMGNAPRPMGYPKTYRSGRY